MAVTVSLSEARTHLSRLLALAHAGQEIIIAKAGKPYARLMPLAAAPVSRRPGRLRGQIDTSALFEPLPRDEPERWDGR